MASEEQPEDSEREITVHGFAIVEEDDIFPLDWNLERVFDTIHDWLTDMALNDLPQNKIAKYIFRLFESDVLDNPEYTLCLRGVNVYENGNYTRIKNEFLPTHCYFQIPSAYYEDLNREDTIKKITADLVSFTRSKTFLGSYFTAANEVEFETIGKNIWPK